MKKVRALVVLSSVALALTLPGAVPASAAGEVCVGIHTGATFAGGIVVPAGQRCNLIRSTVQGNAFVGRGGALIAVDSTITGNLQAEGAAVQLFRSSVGNNVTSIRPTTFPTGPNSFLVKLSMCGSTVSGSVSITDAVGGGPMSVGGITCANTGGGNSIGGSLLYRNNAASGHRIGDNRVDLLICSGNTPSPTGSGNIARLKTGQCATL